MRRDAFFPRIALAAGLAAASLRSIAGAQELVVVPTLVRAEFTVRHLFVSSAHGSIPVVAASVELDAATGLPRSVEATLDPRRIDTGNAGRDRELQQPYWFGTERFPEIRFSGGNASGTAEAFDLPGRLTIKNVTLPLTLHVTVSAGAAGRRRYHAVAGVSRHAFSLYANNADGLVGDRVSLDITFEGDAR